MKPHSFIGWLMEERNYEVLEGNPFIDEIFLWDKTLGGFVKTLREIRKYRWNACLDLQGLFKSAIFCFFSGAKKRFALEEVERGSRIFYTHLIPSFPFLHAVENYLLSAYVSLSSSEVDEKILEEAIPMVKERENCIKPVIYLSERERMRTEEIIVSSYPFVVLCPGTTWASKRWLAERWAKVADKLVEKGYKVVFLGAKADIPVVSEIKKWMTKPCLDLTGKTSIKEAGAIMERASLVISVDSGAMHLAVAVNAKVLALFGPTNPKAQGPYGDEHKVIYKGVQCSPCRERNCPKKICMDLITEEEVMGLAEEILRNGGEK